MIRLMARTLTMGLAVLGASQAGASDVGPVDEQAASTAGANEAVIASASIASSAASMAAQDAAANGDDWNVTFTPYVWIAGTKGDIGIPRGENEVEIDRDFADTLSNLKFAFMGALDVEYHRFVAIADVMYLSVGAEAEGIRDPQFFEGKVDSSVFVGTLAVGYRVVDQGPLFVDVFAGGRLVSLKVDIELEGPLTTREVDESRSRIAPMFGGRVRVPLGEDFGLALYGDVGGFKSSDVKWQLIGTVQWDISRHWRLAAGYRHMQIHHDTRRADFDVALSGPIVGVSYRF